MGPANPLLWMLVLGFASLLRSRSSTPGFGDQVIVGLMLFLASITLFLYTPIPWFWEIEAGQPHAYHLTWRTDVMLFLLLTASQGLSYLAFRRFRRKAS